MKILIIDDNPGDANLIRMACREVTESDDVVHAGQISDVNRFQHMHFQVITVDGEICARLGSDAVPYLRERWPLAQIIMICGSQKCVDDGLRNGANFGFTKPYLYDGYVEGIQRALHPMLN